MLSMASNANKRILVADDNLAVRIMLEDILSEAGYDIVTAEDGQKAFDALKDGKFDLVILDLLMPQKSGFEILEWLREQKKQPMVLVHTGIFRSPEEIERLRKLGAKGYIYKSAPVEEILYRVNRALYPITQDTRKYPRVPVNLNIEYRINSKWHQAFTSTIGSGGMFIRTINPPESGTPIAIKFRLPETGKVVEAMAKVVWRNEYNPESKKSTLPGMGVKFEEINENVRTEIAQFVEERLEKDHIWSHAPTKAP